MPPVPSDGPIRTPKAASENRALQTRPDAHQPGLVPTPRPTAKADELLPQLPTVVVVEQIRRVDGMVTIAAHPPARGARCVRCGRVSTRVHSSFHHRLADLPGGGQPLVLRLPVRRFFRDHDDCRAGTFVKRVPCLTQPHAQRTADANGVDTATEYPSFPGVGEAQGNADGHDDTPMYCPPVTAASRFATLVDWPADWRVSQAEAVTPQ